MKFSSRNVVIIISLILVYALIHSTAKYMPELIQRVSGVQLEEHDITKYKFPVAILAFVLFPAVNWLKDKLDL